MSHLTSSIVKSIITLIVTTAITQADSTIDYPRDYRYWTHVKSMVIQEGHPLHASFGGIHHIYANDMALQGYKTGSFPNGSIIIFDLLEASSADNAITEQERKVLGVMVKDSKKFTTTSGWGFEGFGAGNPDKPLVADNAKEACYACHTSQKDNDYVFSKWRN